MIDVTVESFEQEVIEASMQTPILVDFWAPWCGPCKTLGPLLERLEESYGGRFRLVKIDSDKEQQIAGMFGVRSVPTCVLMSQGQPVDGFMGALPEPQLRAFLEKHLGPANETAEQGEDEADDAAAQQPAQDPLEQLAQGLAAQPDDEKARFAYVRALLEHNMQAEARKAFEPAAALAGTSQRMAALKAWFDALDVAGGHADQAARLAELEQRISADRRDFAARFERAQLLMAARQWPQAMDELLEILMRDRNWNEQLARKTYVAILEIIEPARVAVAEGQIPPQDPLLATYRRRLSSVILS